MISLIVAMDRQGLIGIDGQIPWYRPADLRNFRDLTTGHAIIMGRKTFESLGKPLKNRNHVVITRSWPYLKDTDNVIFSYVMICENVLKKRKYDEEIFIIGGAEIYKAFAPLVERLYITVVNQTTPLSGRESVFFPWPAFTNTSWVCSEQKMLGSDYFYVYDKVKAANNGEQTRTTIGSTTGERNSSYG